MLVGEPFGGDAAVFAGDRPEQRPVADAAEPHPGLEQRDGAGVGARAAADLDLAPAGLAENLQQDAAVVVRIFAGRIDLDPAGPVLALAGAAVEADDLGAAQRPGEAERQDGAVAQSPQVHLERGEHGQELVGEDRRLLHGRAAVAAADAGEHGGDVAVAGVERTAELAVAPADPGEAPLERRNADAGLGLRGEIEADGLRARAAVRRNRCGAARKRTAASRNHRRARCFRLERRARSFWRFRSAGRGADRPRAGQGRPSPSSAVVSSPSEASGASVSASFPKFRRLGEGWWGSFGSISSGIWGISNRVR